MANPRYQTPSSYIGKTGPFAKKKPAPAPRRPAPPALTAQAWADAQAERLVNETVASIREQQAAYNQTLREEAARRAAEAQRFAAMVQGLGIDKQIAGIYGSAGRDIAGMAQGFAGDIRDIAARDAAAQTNMLSGTGQEGAVRNEGVGMGDVVYGVGGYIPGRTMGESGAAFAADAARAPGFMLEQRIGESEKAYQERLAESDQSFLEQILKTKTSKADIARDLYEQKVDMNLAQQKLAMAKLEDDRQYWLKMQALYLSQKKYKLAEQAAARAKQAEQRYRNETMGRDAEGNVSPDYVRLPNGTLVKRSEYRQSQKNKGLDENGNLLPGYARKNGKVVKVATPRATAPKGAASLSPSKQADIMKDVMGKEADIRKKDLPELAKSTGYAALLKRPNVPAKEKARLQKSIARALWVRYVPIAMTPASKRALRNLIDRLVKGYTPGSGGGLTEGLGL